MHILLTGASGLLGPYILCEAVQRGLQLTAWSGSKPMTFFGVDCQPVNLAEPEQVAAAFHAAKPTHVLHAAARASIADCLRHPEQARQVNVAGTEVLTSLCHQHRARLLYVSTDLVFDGEKGNYREADTPHPLSVYGQTKLAAERIALHGKRNLAVRISWLVGPSLSGRRCFFQDMLDALNSHTPLRLFTDEWRTPLGLPTAAGALLDLLQSDITGILHLGGPERLSRYDMGLSLAHHWGLAPTCFLPSLRADAPAPESRPRDVSLDSSWWRSLFPDKKWPTLAETLTQVLGTFPHSPV
jgi:dTDP-4-dehydrorhamnose reductase